MHGSLREGQYRGEQYGHARRAAGEELARHLAGRHRRVHGADCPRAPTAPHRCDPERVGKLVPIESK
jgi:hypothetical protein